MTHDEETMLKGYLRLDGPGFEDWLRSTREGSDAGELEFKAALAEAEGMGAGFRSRGQGRDQGWRSTRAGLRRVDSGAGVPNAYRNSPAAKDDLRRPQDWVLLGGIRPLPRYQVPLPWRPRGPVPQTPCRRGQRREAKSVP